MAANKLKFTRTTTDKLTVKGGVLSEDCTPTQMRMIWNRK